MNGSGYGTIGRGAQHLGKELAHRASYMVHRGAIPDGLIVCHRCDVKLCVNPDHLFLGTYMDNTQDAMSKGLIPAGDSWPTQARIDAQVKGERHGMARLTEAQVREIAATFFAGGITKRQLADRFGVSRATVRNIVLGRNWSHLELAQ